jgi:hypothetical protein
VSQHRAVLARAQHDLVRNPLDHDHVAAHGEVDRAFIALVVLDQDRRQRRAFGPGQEGCLAIIVDPLRQHLGVALRGPREVERGRIDHRVGIARRGQLDLARRVGRRFHRGVGLFHGLGLVVGIAEREDVERAADRRIGHEVKQVRALVGDHRHVGRRAVGERLHEQQVGALVGRDLPLLRIADGDVLDVLVLGEPDRRLHTGLAVDAHDGVRV